MAIGENDIILSYSGGSSNADPNLSLGGDISEQPILSTRLFNDVSEAQSASGSINYRCIYLNNHSSDGYLYNSTINVVYTNSSDVVVEVGIGSSNDISLISTNDRQIVTIINGPNATGGNFTLTFKNVVDYDVVVYWNADLATFSNNFQNALRLIPDLQNVQVSASILSPNIVFEVDFTGGRYYDPFVLKSNNLICIYTTYIFISKAVNGYPFNSKASEIDVETTPPANISFYSSVAVGKIQPLDALPIWIKRTVPPNAAAVQNDGFTLNIEGHGLPVI
jgi:hypothetical protein